MRDSVKYCCFLLEAEVTDSALLALSKEILLNKVNGILYLARKRKETCGSAVIRLSMPVTFYDQTGVCMYAEHIFCFYYAQQSQSRLRLLIQPLFGQTDFAFGSVYVRFGQFGSVSAVLFRFG